MTAALIRTRHDARVRIVPAGRHRSLEWRMDARIPQTRFHLARLRLLADELAEAAEAGEGVLVTWDAVRPGRDTVFSRALHQAHRRTTLIAGADVAVATAGLALQAATIVVAAAVAVLVETMVWLMWGRLTARH